MSIQPVNIPKKRLCLICDSTYRENNEEECKIHEHPEPQSGPFRLAWLDSGMNYKDWINTTLCGKEWVKSNGQRRVC